MPPELSGVARTAPVEGTVAPRLADLLFDRRRGWLLLLAMSAAFGAAHALLPGHGKTVVAAFLVARRGTVWDAVLVGVVTALTHSLIVLAVAALLPLTVSTVSAERANAALGVGGGLLLAGLGTYLLVQRLAGRTDHVHLFGGCTIPERPTARSLFVLGVGGGLLPCWDAVALLVLALSSGRLWLGLPLLLAFSAGLAAVLVGVGVAVVRAGEATRLRLPPRPLRWLERWLPSLSAALVLLVGLWLCYAGARSAG